MRVRALIPVLISAAGCGSPAPPTPAAAPAAPAARPRPLDPAERVENPAYTRWAKFPVGAVVVIEEVTDVRGVRTTTKSTYRLTEKADDALVVEAGGAIKAADGTAQENPPFPMRHARWMPRPAGQSDDPGRPAGTVASGRETVAVRGRDYPTVWYKSKGRVEAGETETQTWLCDQVPGGIVKSVHRIPGASKTISSEVLEVKIP